MSTCSNGREVSQSQINSYYRLAKIKEYEGNPFPDCQACGNTKANDCDHTIPQKRCKELNRTELIWDAKNFVPSCRKCHTEWESYGSGEFYKHRNFSERMAVVFDYDPETYIKRLYAILELYPDLEDEMKPMIDSATKRRLKIALG